MISLYREFIKNKALKQYALLLSSNMGLVLIGFISSYVLTKYMTIDEYGMYKYTLNVASAISLISLVGIPYSASLAIVKEDNKKQVRGISSSAILLLLAVYIIVSSILIILMYFLNRVGLQFEKTTFYAIFITIVLSLQSCFITMYQGSNDIKTISAQTILPPSLVAITVLAIGLYFNKISYETAIFVYFLVYVFAHIITIHMKKISLFAIKKVGGFYN